MKQITYTPELCKGENPVMKGQVELALVKYTDKLRFLKSIGINFTGEGIASEMNTGDKLEFGIKSIEFSKAYYLSVSLVDIKTGEEFKSVEDLEYSEHGSQVLQEVAAKLINGFGLGK